MASFGAVVVHVGPCIMGLLDGNQEMPTGEKCIVYKEFCFVWAQLALAQIALPPLLRTKWRVRSWVKTH